MADFSPMMQQYLRIKEQNKDSILFFRLGDFYEMFFDDAVLASRELELTLTGKVCGMEERAPMCGVPYHASDTYIEKLISKGYKVAICEQVEDPKTAVGIVKRDIVRIVTPGTVIDNTMLDDTKNNFLSSVFECQNGSAIAFADVSTGEVYVTKTTSKSTDKIISELAKYTPSEILINERALSDKLLETFVKEKLNALVTLRDDVDFDFSIGYALTSEVFGDKLNEINIEDSKIAINALGALLKYLQETQCTDKLNLNNLTFYTDDNFMDLDVNTRRNLELTSAMRSGDKKGTLLWVLDKTKTSMGARMLRSYIEKPLTNCNTINKRLNGIDSLLRNYNLLQEITKSLADIKDIERLITKIIYKTANARDVYSLGATLDKIPTIKSLIEMIDSSLIKDINKGLLNTYALTDMIKSSINEDAPLLIREGNLIKSGFNAEIDELSNLLKNGKNIILEIEEKEREKTGFKTLKIGYNRVFGYYIEVTKSNIGDVPENYIRKQTLSNCERYITEELKEIENRILSAKDKICELEYNEFCKIRDEIASHSTEIQTISNAVAQLDVLASLAEVAIKNNYTKPNVDYSSKIEIIDGRHPVVEKMLTDNIYVPNDTTLDNTKDSLAIITGPNMAGKSTYMRAVALITLMAQIGSYVPARAADIGIVDKIFTRVGASDDLSQGQSTFMVEMSETSNIIKNATEKSLIIFDEIGRGTSTFDGMSIARAVLEHVADKKKLGTKTLFATHYHELTELEGEIDGVLNYNVAVKKRGDDITFLRKIVRGPADDSYGIEVAKLAGIPNSVIARAKSILSDLEEHNGKDNIIKSSKPKTEQLSFDNSENTLLYDKISQIDLDVLTPIEALNTLNELKKLL
ncbi:MAG: DNA mismatch repair protein MutS [Clostridia bacterium]